MGYYWAALSETKGPENKEKRIAFQVLENQSTAFGRQGPEVQILSPRPLTDWFINLSTVANVVFIYNSAGTVLRM